MLRHFLSSTALAVSVMGAGALCAQTIPGTVNLIFVVDESGSMSGEHSFLGDVAADVESSLKSTGVSDVRFGLTGFGSGADVAGHAINVGSGLLGTSTEFQTATGTLVLTGGTEDGYSGIDTALSSYDLSTGATTIILVTDEDRDTVNSALDLGAVATALDASRAGIVVVVDAQYLSDGELEAIAVDGSTAYIQDGTDPAKVVTDSYTPSAAGAATSSQGTTLADYVDLAINSGLPGCAADLTILREGGDSATAFSEAFIQCLSTVATVEIITDSGTIRIPMNQFGDVARTLLANHRGAIRGIMLMAPQGTGVAPTVTQDQSVINDMFGIAGLRGYAVLTGFRGDFDEDGPNAAFDYDGGGIIIGSDFTRSLTDAGTLRFGGSLGWTQLNADFDDSDSSLDEDGYQVSLYAGFWSQTGFYALGDLYYASLDYENDRIEDGTRYVSRPDGELLAGEIEAGYTHVLAPGTMRLTPFAALGAEQFDLDGYEENNGGATAEDYGTFTSYGKLGLRGDAYRPVDAGTLYGAFEVSALFPFDDNDTELALSPGYEATIADRSATEYGLSLEMGMEFSQRGRVYIQYAGRYSENLTQHGASLGLSYAF